MANITHIAKDQIIAGLFQGIEMGRYMADVERLEMMTNDIPRI